MLSVISRVFISERGRFEDASQTSGFEDEKRGQEPRNAMTS